MKIGGININLPSMDSGIFSKTFMLNKARRGAQKKIWPLLDKIGAANFQLAIQQNKPFLSTLDPNAFPEEWKGYISQAPQYDPIIAMFNDEDLLSLLPPWLIQMILKDEAGKKWWAGELAFMKRVIKGE